MPPKSDKRLFSMKLKNCVREGQMTTWVWEGRTNDIENMRRAEIDLKEMGFVSCIFYCY